MGVCSGIAYKIYKGFYDTMSDFKDISDLLKTALEISVHAGEIRETLHAIPVSFLSASFSLLPTALLTKKNDSDKLPFDFPKIWCISFWTYSLFL